MYISPCGYQENHGKLNEFIWPQIKSWGSFLVEGTALIILINYHARSKSMHLVWPLDAHEETKSDRIQRPACIVFIRNKKTNEKLGEEQGNSTDSKSRTDRFDYGGRESAITPTARILSPLPNSFLEKRIKIFKRGKTKKDGWIEYSNHPICSNLSNSSNLILFSV